MKYGFYHCSALKVVINHSSLYIEKGSKNYGYVGYYAIVVTDTPSEDGLYYADDVKTQLIAFDGRHQSVVIPNSVTSIGKQAFSGCSSLQSVEIPNSVTSIGYDAFQYCSSLMVVINHSSLNITKGSLDYGYVGYYAKVITDTPSEDGLYYADETKTQLIAFDGRHQSVVIPNSVTSIGQKAFYGCSGLRSVTIGTGVLSVGTDAFKGCFSLYKLTLLPNTVPSGLANALPSAPSKGCISYVANGNYSSSKYGTIKKYDYLSSMFEVDGIVYVPVSPSERTCAAIESSYSSAAKDVAIGKTVKYKGVELKVVEVNPFVLIGNKYVENVRFSTDVDVPKYFASDCGNIKTIELTNNGTIGNYAFRGSMTNVVDGSITLNNTGAIGECAFEGCWGLKMLTVEKTVTNIGGSAFRESMTKSENAQVVLNNVGSIGGSAFYGCTKLQTASLAETINAIGSSAFYKCRNLQNINIPSARCWGWGRSRCQRARLRGRGFA